MISKDSTDSSDDQWTKRVRMNKALTLSIH